MPNLFFHNGPGLFKKDFNNSLNFNRRDCWTKNIEVEKYKQNDFLKTGIQDPYSENNSFKQI